MGRFHLVLRLLIGNPKREMRGTKTPDFNSISDKFKPRRNNRKLLTCKPRRALLRERKLRLTIKPKSSSSVIS